MPFRSVLSLHVQVSVTSAPEGDSAPHQHPMEIYGTQAKMIPAPLPSSQALTPPLAQTRRVVVSPCVARSTTQGVSLTWHTLSVSLSFWQYLQREC